MFSSGSLGQTSKGLCLHTSRETFVQCKFKYQLLKEVSYLEALSSVNDCFGVNIIKEHMYGENLNNAA